MYSKELGHNEKGTIRWFLHKEIVTVETLLESAKIFLLKKNKKTGKVET